MKTALLASTAVVFWTGLAAAQEISLSGSAEMGILGVNLFEDEEGDDSADLEFHTDLDITFTMAGETDTGLTFGANIDIDEAGDGSPFENPRTQGGESIFVSGAFGTLTMGDTDGALDWALQEAIIGSALNDDHEHAGFLGTLIVPVDTDGDGIADDTEVVDVVDGNAALDGRYDGQIARYEYAFTDFAVAVSGEIDDGDDGDPILGLGVRYATSFSGVDMAFGAGVQTISQLDDLIDDAADLVDPDVDVDDNQTVWGVSADMSFAGGFQVILNYSDYDDLGNHYGAAAGYSIDALTVAVNYGKFESDIGGVDDTEGYGVVANYDLGGGAELQAGYGHSTVQDEDADQFSFGVAMSF